MTKHPPNQDDGNKKQTNAGATWKSKIPGCFAHQAAPFGRYPLDEERAREMLITVIEEKATTEDIINEAVRYLQEKGVSEEKIKEQEALIRKKISTLVF